MIYTQQCMLPPGISQGTVKASFEEGTGTREFLDKLRSDQWAVTSFDSKTGLACIDLYSDCGETQHLALTLPVLSNSSRP